MLYYKIKRDGTLKITDEFKKKRFVLGADYKAIEEETLKFASNTKIERVEFHIDTESPVTHEFPQKVIFDECPKLSSINGSNMPSVIRRLDVWGSRNLGDISGMQSSSLEELNIGGHSNKSLKDLPELPAGLKKLYIDSCVELQEISTPLPSSIEDVSIHFCYKFGTIPELPSGVKKLSLHGCVALTQILSELPSELEEFDIQGCEALTFLPKLPSGLKKINIEGCNALESLLELPAGVKTLNVQHNDKLMQISGLGLEEVNVQHCRVLQRLPELSPGVKTLDVKFCENLTEISGSLPLSLETVLLQSCERLESFPELPSGVKKLSVKFCKNLTEISGNLPDSLEEICATYNRSLAAFPVLPSGLKKLDVSYCNNLREILDPIPNSLEEISFYRCESLEHLPALPAGMQRLDLSGCKNLHISEELIAQFLVLENSGCDITYPDHYQVGNKIPVIESGIKSIACQYFDKSAAEISTYPIIRLLHRFGTEDVRGRGENKIASDLSNILLFLKESPESLKWMNKVAEQYLKGCNNQPVAGVTEISFWLEVARAEGLEAKLEAGRLVKLLYVIDSEIRENKAKYLAEGHRLGESFEVEFGNAIKRELHRKLLAENKISKPWPAIAENITHEIAIDSFLTTENIDRLYAVALHGLFEEDLVSVHEHLCDYSEVWSEVTIGPIVSSEEKQCEHIRDLLSKVEDVLVYGEDESTILSNLSDDAKQEFASYKDLYSSWDKGKLSGKLLDLQQEAIKTRDANIAKAKDLQRAEVERLKEQKDAPPLPRANQVAFEVDIEQKPSMRQMLNDPTNFPGRLGG